MALSTENNADTSTVAGVKDGTDEEADAFAQTAIAHPALRESWGVASDIYERLFDQSLLGPLFNRWTQQKDLWQLHVVGGPGAGKVSLLWRNTPTKVLNTILDHVCSSGSHAHSRNSCKFAQA